MANRWKELQSRLAAERQNVSSYMDLFEANPDDEVLVALVNELRGYLFEKSLVLYPKDDLTTVLGIDQDEITDVVGEVVKILGHPLPKSPVILPDIHTVGDLYSNDSSITSQLPGEWD